MTTIILIALGAAMIFYAFKVMKQRAAAFASAAAGLGYSYSAHDSPFTGTDIDGLPLVALSQRHVFRNVLTAKGGSPVVITEFQYDLIRNKHNAGAISDGDSKNRGGNHSLIAYRIAHGSLPKFQVYSRGVFGNMNMPLDKETYQAVVHGGGLDLGNEAFAKRYMVICDESAAPQVRMLFTPFLMRALVDQPPHTWMHIQCSADWLLFYDPMIIVLKPEAIAPALARVEPIAAMITGKVAEPAMA
ncbi:MAG TPA: hypothetical protein VFJ86_04450 [Usitatibacter sp.]|jgi:hypothetical protein|nr:hypothetical protein [Usitatibacter sp.]